jgi:hypothetical protein
MKYQYRPITTARYDKLVSFAVSVPNGTNLWHIRCFYNGDIRTGNRESQLSIPLAQLTTQDLPPVIEKKVGRVKIGEIYTSPDFPEQRELGQYFRGLAGLPRITITIKPRT